MRRTKLSLILAVLISGLVLDGCIALKPNGKISYAKQVYHDITHRNNGYFNAEEKLKKIRLNISTTRKDDYDKLLPIYTDRDPATAKTYSSDLDEVIKKTSTVITNHKPSIYTPNSYLLVGESYYMKGDNDNALITFQYVNTEFKKQLGAAKKPLSKEQKKKLREKKHKKKHKGKPLTAAQQAAANANEAINGKGSGGGGGGKSNSRKPMTALQKKQFEEAQRTQDSINQVQLKEEEAAKKAAAKAKLSANKDSATISAAQAGEGNKGGDDFWHFLKHEPVRPDAMIWLSDTYTEMKKYKEAEAVLTIIDADEGFPSWLKKDVEVARANMYLKKEDIGRAIIPLSWLVEKTKRKHDRARYEYILAQIYEKMHNNGEAIVHYKKVLDCHPNYIMSFHAKMSFARIAVNDNSMPSGEVVKLLKKLLNDSKNKEFYGQVYFALAELALKDGDKQGAIVNYKRCITSSGGDAAQKSRAYLKLGELYFEEENYVLSQPYYDSSLTLLQKDDPKRPEVSKRASILKNLVTQVTIIHDNDSLLTLSKMSDREREQFVEDQIRKEEEEKKQKEADQKFLLQQNNATSTTPVDRNAFYFDNPDAKATGYNDFIKRWGERKLDDNWRRMDKSVTITEDTAKAEEDTTKGKEKLTKAEQMLKNIPSSDAEIKKATGKVIDAYYMLGTIYNIDLNNPPKAIATFEELLRRFAENKWQAETYYNLYLLHEKMGNHEKSDFYKNLVLTKFADSQFASIIKDPDFIKKQTKTNNALNDFYSSTYSYYLQGAYDSVINRKPVADSLLKASKTLKPKFDLLEAYAIGKSKDLRSYKDALQLIVKQYPTDSVHTIAQQILKYIETSKDSAVHIKNDMTRYEFSVEARHFFLLAIKNDTTKKDSSAIKIPDVISQVAQFNNAKYSAKRLGIEPTKLADGNIIIAVKSFDNLKQAREYYDAFVAANVLSKFPPKSIGIYMISDVNMNKVMQNKEVNSYFEYFNTKYLQKP